MKGSRGANGRRQRPAWSDTALATLAIAALALLASFPARAIEELEAEENISDLLPPAFPGATRGDGFAERPWVILPQLGYAPDTGPMVGAKFTHRDLYDSGTTLDMDGTYAINHQQSFAFSVASPHLLDNRLLLLLRLRYQLDPHREFFGLGNNDIGPDPASTHEIEDTAGALTIGWRPFERVAFNAAIGIRRVAIRRGHRINHFPFTPDAFPDLPGINGGVVNPLALSLVWNSRDDIVRPTHGWRLILKAIHTNQALFSDFEYTRYLFDAGYLRAFNTGHQIAGLRINGEWIEAPLHRVPFWELSELGGQDTLRGFFPHRFVGKARALINLELRSRLTEFDFCQLWHGRLDGVLFGDGGRVFIDNNDLRDEFRLNGPIVDRLLSDFQYSYGAGLRLALSEAIVARLDAGFSNEEAGLLYLSFGHTF